MSTRKINVTFEIEDNDVVEYQLELILRQNFSHCIIDYMKFPNTEHLKENEAFKKLIKLKKQAGLELDRFINDNRQ